MADTMMVAMSGGVDSTVAAHLLRDRWKKMAGATHYIWPNSRCCSLEVQNRAEKACKALGIPYYIVNLEKEFRREVVNNFINTYIEGRTPNPCIICNKKIRFDYFYNSMNKLLRAKGNIEDDDVLYMATGHYVRLERKNGNLFLQKGTDPVKDQSYMLYRIPQTLLERLTFPLGNYLKSEVYRIAESLGIHDKSLKESQDVCFVNGDYGKFIEKETGRDEIFKHGLIKDISGNVLGKHRGYIYYTIGQRRGLNLGSGPWYVSGIDAASNIIFVARKEDAESRRFTVGDLSWFGRKPETRTHFTVKIRYQSSDIKCAFIPEEDNSAQIILEEPAFITPGQSAVFYSEDLVMGGGFILSVIR
ncbi:MAG: tRNA 2-thiouridine(34) synthase MnmA [Spirochaetales bacterium]|nr:tRNA 2-thiouridine(34) synthase MnmA [Spirochaetales bacterium]